MARSRRDDEDTPKKKPRRPVEDDDEEEVVRPKAKKKVPEVIDDDRDEDGEEEDVPRRKSDRKSKSNTKAGLSKPLLIGGAVGLMLLLGGGAIGIYSLFLSDSPKAAFNDFVSAAEKRDGARMWDRMDKKSQENMSKSMAFLKGGSASSKYQGKSDRDLYAVLIDESKDSKGDAFTTRLGKDKPTVESYTSSGDSGSVVIKLADGKTETVYCVKEDGRWRLQLSRGGP